jgi:hypothetical protein
MKELGTPSVKKLEKFLEVQRIIDESKSAYRLVRLPLEDEKKAKQLKSGLEKRGFKTWIEFDPWDRQFLLYWSEDPIRLSAA